MSDETPEETQTEVSEITPTAFLRARLEEVMTRAKSLTKDSLMLITFSNVVDNMKVALDWHDNFPVLVTEQPEFNLEGEASGLDEIRYRMTQEINWFTNQEYVKRFGTEPPTSPLLLAWLQQYAWHPDFREEWLLS